MTFSASSMRTGAWDTGKDALHEGLAVETFDGQYLGTVSAVDDAGLVVHRAHKKDFWLPDVFVRTVDDNKVVLQLDFSRLGRYVPVGRRGFRGGITLGLTSAAVLSLLSLLAH